MTRLIISNKEMNNTMKIVKATKYPSILIRGVTKRIKNEIKEQKRQIFRNAIYQVLWELIFQEKHWQVKALKEEDMVIKEKE